MGSLRTKPFTFQLEEFVVNEPLCSPWNDLLVQIVISHPRLITVIIETKGSIGIHVNGSTRLDVW